MTKQFDNLFQNNVQRRLGYAWNHCRHHKPSPEARQLLNDWVIAEYMEHIAPKYTVEVVAADPYSGDAELRCRVSRTNHIEVFAWSKDDCERHFMGPVVGQMYQAMHDVVHHAEQDFDFGCEGERQSMLQMKRDLIAFGKDQGYEFGTLKEAVNVLVSHTYLRVLGILWLLEIHGNTDKYKHRLYNVCK